MPNTCESKGVSCAGKSAQVHLLLNIACILPVSQVKPPRSVRCFKAASIKAHTLYFQFNAFVIVWNVHGGLWSACAELTQYIMQSHRPPLQPPCARMLSNSIQDVRSCCHDFVSRLDRACKQVSMSQQKFQKPLHGIFFVPKSTGRHPKQLPSGTMKVPTAGLWEITFFVDAYASPG